MARIIQKRRALHESLAKQGQENEALRVQNLQLQVLANLGSATALIAHEINNLLTPLANYAALAVRNPQDSDLVAKALDKTVSNCQRASRLMDSVLAMANGQTEQAESTEVRAMVNSVFDCLCRDFQKDGIRVVLHIDDGLSVTCVPVQIQHVLMNLILNARDAMLPGGGTLTVTATQDGPVLEIAVGDTGSGIAPENIEKVFEPFFTTKTKRNNGSSHSGSGVGLAFCRQVVEAHKGEISVTSRVGQGSTFRVRLPAPPS